MWTSSNDYIDVNVSRMRAIQNVRKHRNWQGANTATEASPVLITDYISNEIAGSGIYMSSSADSPLHEKINFTIGVSEKTNGKAFHTMYMTFGDQ